MKAMFVFKLPEEESQFNDCRYGGKYKAALQEIDNTLRNYQKHGHKFKSADEAIDEIRKMVLEDIWYD